MKDLLMPGCIRVPMAAKDKTAAITELVDVLHQSGQLFDRDAVLHAVLERERTRSTGFEHSLAVPHGKSTGCRKLVMAVGKPATPIDFGSRDGKPTEVILLLASPVDEAGPHIQALARITRLWLDPKARQAALEASTAEALYEVLTSKR